MQDAANQVPSNLIDALRQIAQQLAGDPQGAAAAAAALLKKYPGQHEVLSLFVDARRLAVEIRSARNFIRAQSALYPGIAAYFYVLGVLLAEDDDYDGAVVAFSRATALEPKNGEAWQVLGDAYSVLGKPQAAASAYTQSLYASNPGQVPAP